MSDEMTATQRAARIQALRDLADLLEACPALPTPGNIFAHVRGLTAEEGAALLAEAGRQVAAQGIGPITFTEFQQALVFAMPGYGGLVYETDQHPADIERKAATATATAQNRSAA